MNGTILSGSLECWRGTGEEEMPVDVTVTLQVWKAPPEEGRGYEVDVVEARAGWEPFALTDAEVERAVEQFTEDV